MNWLFLMLVTVVIGLVTQGYIKSTFNKWSRIPASTGFTGAQTAASLMQRNAIAAAPGAKTGTGACAVAAVGGSLTDHYDPRTGVVSLSQPVFGRASIAAVAVAAHETGHALQDADGYIWGKVRTALVPVVNFGSSISGFLIIIGIFIHAMNLVWLGIIFYAAAVLFQLVTLPVEFDASRRGLAQLGASGILTAQELPGARQVLVSAALTYVGAALISLLNLVYYLSFVRRD